MFNQVVLRGVLSRAVQTQVLPSEAVVARLEVRTRTGDKPADTVPAVWFDPPAWVTGFDAGAEVVVLGRVRRRFYRAGGSTQSRTEVVADRVVRPSARRRTERLLLEAAVALEAAMAPSPDVAHADPDLTGPAGR